MRCPDCLEAMAIHRHEEWPKMTYHCACGMVMYRNEKKKEVILEDPTEAQIELDEVPIEDPGTDSPQHAHKHRRKTKKDSESSVDTQIAKAVAISRNVTFLELRDAKERYNKQWEQRESRRNQQRESE